MESGRGGPVVSWATPVRRRSVFDMWCGCGPRSRPPIWPAAPTARTPSGIITSGTGWSGGRPAAASAPTASGRIGSYRVDVEDTNSVAGGRANRSWVAFLWSGKRRRAQAFGWGGARSGMSACLAELKVWAVGYVVRGSARTGGEVALRGWMHGSRRSGGSSRDRAVGWRRRGRAANIADVYPLAWSRRASSSTTLWRPRNGRDAYVLPIVLGFDSRERLDTFLKALRPDGRPARRVAEEGTRRWGHVPVGDGGIWGAAGDDASERAQARTAVPPCRAG